MRTVTIMTVGLLLFVVGLATIHGGLGLSLAAIGAMLFAVPLIGKLENDE